MLVELSPLAYMAVCGLVRDAMMNETDASQLLARVAVELRSATAGGMIPSELAENPSQLESLRHSGFLSH